MPATQSSASRSRRTVAYRAYVLAPVALIAVGSAYVGAHVRVPDGEIVPGVHVGDLDLGGKTLDAARAALNQWASARQNAVLTLHFAPDTGIKRIWKTDAERLGLGIDVNATLDSAAGAGRQDVIGQVSSMLHSGHDIPVAPHVTIDASRIRSYLVEIAHTVDRRPKNARLLLIKGGGFGLKHEVPGRALDRDAAVTSVTQAWDRLNSDQTPPASSGSAPPQTGEPQQTASPTPPVSTAEAAPVAADVELPMKATQAKITYALLSRIDGELGSFATTYAVGDRGDNIHLATSHINGTLLMPGEVFSYNRVVGPRIESAGFKEAPVIIHGALKPGIGGGICQVSSTLFNAVLKSDLKIVRRSHHAFPVHYLPAGRDATVVDGEIDFQFQNNTEAPIYISAYAHHGLLSFALFGKKVPGREVTMVQGRKTVGDTSTETISDASLPVGVQEVKEPGHPDIRVTWYRVVRQDGKVVSREPIHTHYSAFPTTIVVGTRPRRARVHRSRPTAVVPTPPAPAVAPDTTPVQ